MAKKSPAKKKASKPRTPTVADLRKQAREREIVIPRGSKKADIEKLLAAADQEPEPLRVVDAVRRDLEDIAKRDPELARSGLAATALALARDIDLHGNSATSRSMCAARLSEILAELRDLAPEEEEGDGIDELHERRRERQAKAGIAA